MAKPKTAADKYIKAARTLHESEGRVEFDDKPRVSMLDKRKGAYVQAWIWVAAEDMRQIVKHTKVKSGRCPVCFHYPIDCTGKEVKK